MCFIYQGCIISFGFQLLECNHRCMGCIFHISISIIHKYIYVFFNDFILRYIG